MTALDARELEAAFAEIEMAFKRWDMSPTSRDDEPFVVEVPYDGDGYRRITVCTLGDIRALLATLPATPATGSVGELQWKKVGYTQQAETPIKAYIIQPVDNDLGPHWEAHAENRGLAWSSRDTEQEIKAACQADAALAAVPVLPVEPVKFWPGLIGGQSIEHIRELVATVRAIREGLRSPQTSELEEVAMVLSAVASPPITEVEPVAFIVHETDVHGRDHWFCDASDYASKVEAHIAGVKITPLYTRPAPTFPEAEVVVPEGVRVKESDNPLVSYDGAKFAGEHGELLIAATPDFIRCPRPANDRPDSETVESCNANGLCGCCYRLTPPDTRIRRALE